ncbi:MAG TPA: hypothetical protein VJ836_06430 [Candidatus Saccharimonadales bacterium]|nr:hypothetical protein [Candidatus Saccharimonadales bacterium]
MAGSYAEAIQEGRLLRANGIDITGMGLVFDPGSSGHMSELMDDATRADLYTALEGVAEASVALGELGLLSVQGDAMKVCY